MAHKIYKKNFQFKNFQFVILTPDGSQSQVKSLKEELSEIENAVNWNFVYSSHNEIEKVFNSLGSNYSLDANMASPYVFIIDKDRSLRGRDDDDDLGLLYGFDSSDYSEVNNKMSDDVRVILAEYRLALKKYNSKREI